MEFLEVVKVFREKLNANKPVYIKPLYFAKIKGNEIGRVLVNNVTTVNILPLSM